MRNKEVPITLITGYLGSGKTTLINYLLKNTKGNKMAVIVNDIGEVNIDEDLIEKSGVVSSKDDNLVPLSNGCICCTLKADLLNQLESLVNQGKFDHILIEASGICEPVPIAQTITYVEQQAIERKQKKPYYLDAIVSVTDALRLRDEFGCGEILEETIRGEEDIENLVIQQIEFCDVIILNKTNMVSKEELERIKKVIKALQPHAKIVDANFCEVDINEMIDTHLFNFEKASTSAAWFEEFDDRDNEIDADTIHEDDDDDDDEHDEHEHHHHHDDDDDDDDDDEHEEHGHHHHHHHHEHGVDQNDDEGTAEEYGIGTFVYYRRRPFDREKFDKWAETDHGRAIIRSKGIIYFESEYDKIYMYEQAGRQKTLADYGKWYATVLTKKEIEYYLRTDETFRHDWDEKYGDRMIKLVFIGQNINKSKIKSELDEI